MITAIREKLAVKNAAPTQRTNAHNHINTSTAPYAKDSFARSATSFKGYNDHFLAKLTDYIAKDPENMHHYTARGFHLLRDGEKAKALKDFTKAAELNPEHVAAHYGKGKALLALEEPQKAIEAYSKAIELEPRHHESYFGIGQASEKLREPKNACDAYTKALEIEPNQSEYLMARADLHKEYGHFEDALKDYNNLARPNMSKLKENQIHQVYVNRAICHTYLGEIPQAMIQAGNAQKLMPGIDLAPLTKFISDKMSGR